MSEHLDRQTHTKERRKKEKGGRAKHIHIS